VAATGPNTVTNADDILAAHEEHTCAAAAEVVLTKHRARRGRQMDTELLTLIVAALVPFKKSHIEILLPTVTTSSIIFETALTDIGRLLTTG
jgi:hypothetical protein